MNFIRLLPAMAGLLISTLTAAEIPPGAHVLLRMQNSVTTRTAKEGDFVYLRTASPIASEGAIAVPEGSYVQGVVSRAKPSGRVAGRAFGHCRPQGPRSLLSVRAPSPATTNIRRGARRDIR